MEKKNRLLWVVFALLFLVMLLFTVMTPMIKDDFSYCFSWADVSRVRSFGQVVDSMRVHRTVTNGRVLPHGIVQLLLIRPKGLFNLLNALNAVLLAWLVLRWFRDLEGRWPAALLLCGIFLVWNEMPGFGAIFLWLDGAVNYSWGLSLFLLFLWPYGADWLGLPRRRALWRDLLLLPLAFAAGAWSENGSVAILFAAACLTGLTARREKRLSWQPLAGLLAGLLGFVFLMSAPATAGRSAAMSFSVLAGNLKTITEASREALLPLYVIFALLFALCLPAKADRKQLILAAVLLLAGLGSLAAFVFALYFADRHFCFTVFFTVLAILILAAELVRAGRKTLPALLLAGMSVLFVFNFVLGALDIAQIYNASLRREAAIQAALAAGEKDITLEVYVPATPYSAPRTNDLEFDPNLWPNDSVALYYGFDSVTGVWPGE